MKLTSWDLIRQLKESNQTVREHLWVYAFNWREIGAKILRNIPPTQITITMTSSRVTYQRDRLSAVSEDKHKVIDLDSNAYGSECVIYDNYEECAAAYNKEILDTIERREQGKAYVLEKYEANLKKARDSLIPGFIVKSND
jgi:hypothetical protein